MHSLLCSKHLRLLSKSLKPNWVTELSLKWYYKDLRCGSVLIVWVVLLFFISPRTLLYLLRLWLLKRHLKERKNKRGRNMNESNISLIAQLRECDDADNGPVLIKLYFFPVLCSSFKRSFWKCNFLLTRTSNAHVACLSPGFVLFHTPNMVELLWPVLDLKKIKL